MLAIHVLLVLHFLAITVLALVLQDDACKEMCDKERATAKGKEVTFICNGSYTEFDSCLRLCESCPPEVCDEFEQKNYQFQFYCPSKEQGKNPTTMPENKRRYKGKCKDRCEKSRAGGPHDFRLNCSSAYNTKPEQDLCLTDCNLECPEDVCYNNDTISCKRDQRETRRIEQEKNNIEISISNDYAMKNAALNKYHRITMITLSVLLVIVILATVVFVWLTVRKKKVAPEVINGITMSMQETRTLRDVSTSGLSSSSESNQGKIHSK